MLKIKTKRRKKTTTTKVLFKTTKERKKYINLRMVEAFDGKKKKLLYENECVVFNIR